MAALALRARNIDVAIISNTVPKRTSSGRASVVHAFTLEILAQYGLADRLVSRGNPVGQTATSDRKVITGTMDLGQMLADKTPFPYVLVAMQSETEDVLVSALSDRGLQVHAPATFETLAPPSPPENEWTVTLADGRIIRAQYIVAADGMRSKVRASLGVTWKEHDVLPEQVLLADAQLNAADDAFPRDRTSLYLSQAGFFSAVPHRTVGLYRLISIAQDPPAAPSPGDLERIIAARGPITEQPIEVEDVLWSSRVRLHEQIVPTFRPHPRAFLIGDAAHVHSPTGGQGLNIAIADAYMLGEALYQVFTLSATEDELDEWAKKRRGAAERAVAISSRLLHGFKAAWSTQMLSPISAPSGSNSQKPDPAAGIMAMSGLVDRPEGWEPIPASPL